MVRRWRQKIDELDDQVLELLNRRAQVALELAAEKGRRGWPILDPEREDQVIRRLGARNGGPLSNAALARIYRAVMAEMRALQASRDARA